MMTQIILVERKIEKKKFSEMELLEVFKDYTGELRILVGKLENKYTSIKLKDNSYEICKNDLHYYEILNAKLTVEI